MCGDLGFIRPTKDNHQSCDGIGAIERKQSHRGPLGSQSEDEFATQRVARGSHIRTIASSFIKGLHDGEITGRR